MGYTLLKRGLYFSLFFGSNPSHHICPLQMRQFLLFLPKEEMIILKREIERKEEKKKRKKRCFITVSFKYRRR